MALISLPLVPVPVEYRDIPGFPGYRVGSDGSVWSLLRCRRLKTYCAGKGYLAVNLRRDGVTVRAYVHWLVAEAFIGPRPSRMDVCHHDNVRHNNVPSNLRYDTRSGNLADRDRHGTHQRGERNPASRLTNAQAQKIRELRSSGIPLKVLAFLFGVRESTISRIANGLRRKELESGN